MAKVKDEIALHYKTKSQTDLTIEDVNSMEFLSLMIKETLRFNGPVNGIFIREALQDHKIGDIKIKQGISVSVGFVHNSSNPKNYDAPEKFDPYRWTEGRSKKICTPLHLLHFRLDLAIVLVSTCHN